MLVSSVLKMLTPARNIALKIFRPSIWIPAIMVAWGIVMTLMGIVQNYTGLLVARLFLGVTEAGLFPGVAVRDTSSAVSSLNHC